MDAESADIDYDSRVVDEELSCPSGSQVVDEKLSCRSGSQVVDDKLYGRSDSQAANLKLCDGSDSQVGDEKICGVGDSGDTVEEEISGRRISFTETQTYVIRRSRWTSVKVHTENYRNWLGVVFARLIFLVVAVVCIGLTVAVVNVGDEVYLLFAPILLLIAEAVFSFRRKGNIEWKWVTPCIYTYLLCIVPSIWIMEYDGYQTRMELDNVNLTLDKDSVCNGSIAVIADITDNLDKNIFDLPHLRALADDASSAARTLCFCYDCPSYINQAMLFSLVIGRWILPKSIGLSAEQKSQLLLVNIAVAADILDLYDMLKEDKVYNDETFIHAFYFILSVWTFSLLQFGVVATATADRDSCVSCFRTEIWSLLTLLCMDDLTFLVVRLYLAISLDIIGPSTVFFIGKNIFVLLVDASRIITIHSESRNGTGERSKSSRAHLVCPAEESCDGLTKI